MMKKIYMIYGTENCTIYDNSDIEEVINDVQIFKFDTQKESEAFLLGVNSAVGFLEFREISESEYKLGKKVKKYK